jgi:hypothetical protein
VRSVLDEKLVGGGEREAEICTVNLFFDDDRFGGFE